MELKTLKTKLACVPGLLSQLKLLAKNAVYAVKEVLSRLFSQEGYSFDDRRMNRSLVLFLGFLVFADYLMFCFHADKNVFDLLPALPSISDQHEITVYLPSLNGKTLLTEKRMATDFKSRERYIHYLFNTVIRGSVYENTALAVPVALNIRSIWIAKSDKHPGKEICAIDCEVPVGNPDVTPIQGSENLFKEALTKTVSANISDIDDVVLLEKGIQNRRFW